MRIWQVCFLLTANFVASEIGEPIDRRICESDVMSSGTNRQRAIGKQLTLLLPAVPYSDSEPIRAAATAPHMKTLPPPIAVWLATVAHVRHQHTDYDALRDDGYDKESATDGMARNPASRS
jgi:hypothetical protein